MQNVQNVQKCDFHVFAKPGMSENIFRARPQLFHAHFEHFNFFRTDQLRSVCWDGRPKYKTYRSVRTLAKKLGALGARSRTRETRSAQKNIRVFFPKWPLLQFLEKPCENVKN